MYGTSIHIGVNEPATPSDDLIHSEHNALAMAGLAFQAGYTDIHLLRGAGATRQAVHERIWNATGALKRGETLLVSFSGHGSLVRDESGDEGGGFDETWCLADGDLVDDELAECWRRAPEGSRIVLVGESCFGDGMSRHAMGAMLPYSPWQDEDEDWLGDDDYGGEVMRGVKPFAVSSSCIASGPTLDYGIRASVLVLAAASETQHATEGVYLRHLLKLWDNGNFTGSFCDLHRRLCEDVRHDAHGQEPQIHMLGAEDLKFPLEIAFHLEREVTRG